jgi:ABC-type branched-subunit amino acid transport system substrate-binding protein
VKHLRGWRELRRSLVAAIVSIAVVIGTGSTVVAQDDESKSGEPVTIALITELTSPSGEIPNPVGGVKAHVKAMNANGGVEDASGAKHKVKLFVCDTKFDPNEATKCGRDAVDRGAIVAVGTSTNESAQVFPILEEAGIPSIGTVVIDPVGAQSPVSFPITAGAPPTFMAMPELAVSTGGTTVSYVYVDLGPTSAVTIPLFEQGIQLAGGEKGRFVPTPPDTTDFAPAVAAATADGADTIASFLIGEQQGTFLQTARQQGLKANQLITTSQLLTPDLIDSLGDTANGVKLVSTLPPSTSKGVEGIDLFNKEMAKYSPSVPKTDLLLNGWLSTWIFEQVAAGLDQVDADALLNALNEEESLDTMGLTPSLDFTKELDNPILPRIFNPTVTFNKVKRGQVVPLKSGPPEFVNPFTFSS